MEYSISSSLYRETSYTADAGRAAVADWLRQRVSSDSSPSSATAADAAAASYIVCISSISRHHDRVTRFRATPRSPTARQNGSGVE